MESRKLPDEDYSHLIDVHIGKRVIERRAELQIMLESLSIQSGISIADLLRIESGKIKVTASQVFNLSHALHVSANYFFENYNYCQKKEIERLLSAYLHITKTNKREEILRIVESSIDQYLN